MEYKDWLASKKITDPYTGLTEIPELNPMLFPIQLQVIHRALQLWSMPGDVVLSPFAGIASEGWESVKNGRKFVGIELKESYFNQAVKNMKEIEKESKSEQLDFTEHV